MTADQLLTDAALAAEWDALAALASEPNPFAERWYLQAALASVAPDSVRIAVMRDGGLIGIVPLCTENRYAGLPLAHVRNWINHNAFLGTPLVRSGAEKNFGRRCLRISTAKAIARCSCTSSCMNASGRWLPRWIRFAKSKAAATLWCISRGTRFAGTRAFARCLLEANVRGKKRKELRRQHKRLAEEGMLSFERSDGSDGPGPLDRRFPRAGTRGLERRKRLCAGLCR